LYVLLLFTTTIIIVIILILTRPQAADDVGEAPVGRVGRHVIPVSVQPRARVVREATVAAIVNIIITIIISIIIIIIIIIIIS
jgi:hypothetical protein